MINSTMNRIVHFPNLNGLRFIAAFAVLIHHVEQYRFIYKQTNYWLSPGVMRIGEQGVTLFFVLSGFLITYLLLTEKENFGEIVIPKFYFRRVLRIWPLYFLVVGLAFIVMPRIHFFYIPEWSAGIYDNLRKRLFLYGIITPNLALALYGVVPYLAQAWSIGTEEQFYLVWPWVIQKTKRYLLVITILFLTYTSFKYFIGFLSSNNIMPGYEKIKVLNEFLYWFRIESMFVGAIFAVLLFFNHKELISILMSKITQVLSLLSIIFLLLWGYPIPVYSEVFSILFGILVLNLAACPQSIINLEHPILNFLGRISYGLYMLQTIAIVIAIKIMMLPVFLLWPNWTKHASTLFISLVVLIIVSVISYYGVEKPFLRIKKGFMSVKSSA